MGYDFERERKKARYLEFFQRRLALYSPWMDPDDFAALNLFLEERVSRKGRGAPLNDTYDNVDDSFGPDSNVLGPRGWTH